MKKSLKMPVSVLKLNKRELAGYSLQGVLLAIVFGYFFYRSVLITICLVPLSYLYVLYKSRESGKKRDTELLMQFKEMLVSVCGSLHAGYSLENAFTEALKDMRQMYGDKADIVRELIIIQSGLDNNRDIVSIIEELALRSGLGEIESFAGVLSVGRRSGGNLTDNMESYIRVIEEKAGVIQEIETMISARRFEQKIMNAVPFLIIFYVELTNKGFFSILYHNLFGNIVMTVTLGIYILSVYLSKRIIEIEV